MIKGLMGDTIVLGLSEMNIQKLKEGKPMSFSLAALGIDRHCAIIYGKTEQAILDNLKQHDMKIVPANDKSH